MKTLIALSIAIASLTFQVQAQSDTIEFNATIPTKNLSMDEVHGILMNYLALKCDNWMQVIQIRNSSTGQISLFLKNISFDDALYVQPLINQSKITMKISIFNSYISIFFISKTYNIPNELFLINAKSIIKEIASYIE
jgi:hypothetical protein